MRMLLSVSLALALACYGLFAYVTLDRRADDVQIKTLIADTVTAMNKRDLSGTVRCLSEKYTDQEGLNHDRLRMLVAQAFRAEPAFTAAVELSAPSIEGSDATVSLQAVVKGKMGDRIYNHKLVLHLRKESVRHMGIMPAKVWRVVGVENLGLASQL
jgi:hypothetical protein